MIKVTFTCMIKKGLCNIVACMVGSITCGCMVMPHRICVSCYGLHVPCSCGDCEYVGDIKVMYMVKPKAAGFIGIGLTFNG
jgi:hypothetical protein